MAPCRLATLSANNMEVDGGEARVGEPANGVDAIVAELLDEALAAGSIDADMQWG